MKLLFGGDGNGWRVGLEVDLEGFIEFGKVDVTKVWCGLRRSMCDGHINYCHYG